MIICLKTKDGDDNMKRVLITLILIFLLSGCKNDEYDYGLSRISDIEELKLIMNNMMEEGNHDENTIIPHDLTSVVLTYKDGSIVIDGIWYNINTGFDGEFYSFDNFGCQNVNDVLKCKEEKLLGDRDELNEQIKLIDAIDLFSSVNISDLVIELKREYEIYSLKQTVVSIDFESFNDEDIFVNDFFENVIVYYGNAFHYNEVYYSDDIMLSVRVYFETDSETKMCIVYFEID